MGHFVAAVRVTVGYSDTFADPRGCHSNRQPLYINYEGMDENGAGDSGLYWKRQFLNVTVPS